MFKKIEETIAEEVAKMLPAINEFQLKMETAGKIPDAGERYMVLAEIETEINVHAAKIDRRRRSGRIPDAIGLPAGVTGLFTAAGGGFLTLIDIMSGAPVFTAASMLIGGGAAVLSRLKTEENDKIYQREINACVESTFGKLSQKVKEQKKSILLNELPGIAASPRFDELYESAPEVEEAFNRAATRKAAKESVMPPRTLKTKPPSPENSL